MADADDLERRLRHFNPDDHEAECAREALAELSEVLSLRGMARRNAASKFLSDFETTLRSALSSADELARLRAENEALREAVKIALTCTPSARNGEVIYDCGNPWEILSTALQEGSRHE